MLFLLLSGCSSQSDLDDADPLKAVRSGELIYNTYCFACHEHGAAGAPTLSRPQDWGHRLEKGYENLLQQVQSGVGAMPKNGSCFDCSDAELRSVVSYVLSQLNSEGAAAVK